ncbi:MAG: SurA N-terminal domain-containing protein [Betaproteobacteria bacterium]|nr:SurA N-terminal domain-containing protein [Betaproteobacteria bacterium]
MFDFVERHKRILQIFLAIIGLTFATWGIESYTRFHGGADTVAEVNGLRISQREFDQEVQRQQDQLRRMFGRSYDPSILDTPESRRTLLEGMINQRLVASAAIKANLVVTDEMLVDTIHSIPAFQTGGQFDKGQYELALRSQNPPMSPAQFESKLRTDLTLQQLAGAVGGTAMASRTVSERLAALEAQKREVSEAVVPAEQFLAKATIDDAKAKAYYDSNQAEFRTPERVRAEYVLLSADALARLDPPTEAEVKQAYEARAAQLKVDEQRRASHILVKTKEEADEVLAELKASPGRFAELAKKYSQDTGSAAKGGDLGWFGPGMMVKPFEEAVFGMKKEGELAGPVQSEFGFHIIKLTGIQGAKTRSFEEVRPELTAELARQKGQRKFAESAEAFGNLVYEQPDSLKPAAERFKLQIRTTPWIAKSAAQELGPLDNPKLLAALFSPDSIKNKRNTDAIEVAPGTLVAARVAEYQPEAQRSFEEAKAEILDKLRRREAVELARKDGEAKLEQLKKGSDAAVKWNAPKTVSRRDPQGLPPEVLQKVVAADVSKLPAYTGLLVPEKGYALLRISRVIDPDPKQSADNEPRTAQLYGSSQFQAYLASLRSQADIEVRKENLERKQ